jgi:hypothetical protein
MPVLGWGGSRVKFSSMHLNPSPGAPGPGLPESMRRSILSAMWKELWPMRRQTDDPNR